MSSIVVNRVPVLTLWAAVAGSAARIKARSIGREERKADRDAETPRLTEIHVTAPAFPLGKAIRLLTDDNGELRAADGDRPADPAAVERYLVKAFGARLAEVRTAMETLAARFAPAELNRIGFRLYEASPGRAAGQRRLGGEGGAGG